MKEKQKRILSIFTAAALILQPLAVPAAVQAASGGAIWGESPISEPYPYVQDGGFTGAKQPASPDPLVNYRWDDPKASDDLEIFLRQPIAVDSEQQENFAGMESLTSDDVNVEVNGEGMIRLDFGVEFAGWLEIDSPDLSGDVRLGVSEYDQPAYVNAGPRSPSKMAAPVRYGDTYRVELNDELYEGARFGFIKVADFDQPFHITGIRLVCQTKPVNYNSSFSSNNELLNKIWYTAAYDVRANLKKDYMAAIIVDRGDRHSWTGDAYPTQAAALTAFGNYDFVLKNIEYTDVRSNGIETYELQWVLSLIDYYEYTGDADGVRGLLNSTANRLEHAYDIYGANTNLSFVGWDERLGGGFENPNIAGNRESYKLLAIQTWKDFAAVLSDIGEDTLADKYRGYAEEKTDELRADPDFYKDYWMHTAADAINAGVLTEEETAELAEKHFTDRVNRISYSPFNQYFVTQAMGEAGYYDDAIGATLDLFGGMVEYGGTTFFENYRPDWNDIVAKNGPVPSSQCGYTSLAHPWGAGVLTWLSEEVLGIKAVEAGFDTFAVKPHLGRSLTQVSGDMYTPHGTIQAAFDTNAGTAQLSVPEGTTAVIGIPKAEKTITAVKMNGTAADIASEDDEFVFIEDLGAGDYQFEISYEGETPEAVQREYIYPAEVVGKDTDTKGYWGGTYGSDGYILCGSNESRVLPDYVESVSFGKIAGLQWDIPSNDERALADNPYNVGNRMLGAYRTGDNNACWQTMTMDIDLKEQLEYTVALYFADYGRSEATGLHSHDDGPRELSVEMFDGKTLNMIAPTQMLNDYTGGVYLIYKYDGSARFRINQVRGLNATLSGVFFGEIGADAAPLKTMEMIDERDQRVIYSGNGWSDGPHSDAFGGTLRYSKTAGDAAEFTFTGDNITFMASKESNRGMAEIYLDGQSQGIFDMYSPSLRRQINLFSAENLSEGEHTIRIVVTGDKNELASDCFVDLDAFVIEREFTNQQGRMIDDQNSAVTYEGTWNHDPISGAYADTFSYSNNQDDYAELVFAGQGVSYYASKESNRGLADVYIDGEYKETVDLYSAATLRRQKVFQIDGLDPNESHAIKVVVNGGKNASAAGAYVDVDAFEVITEQFTPENIADAVFIRKPAVGDTAIKLSPIPDDYQVAITGSSHPDIIGTDGSLAYPELSTDVTLTITVSKDGREVQREITVPLIGSKTAEAAAAEVTALPEQQSSGTFSFPELPRGFTAEIYSSSHPDIIATDGTITAPAEKTSVEIVLRIIKNDGSSSALTAPLITVVPARSIPLQSITVTPGTLTFKTGDKPRALSVGYLPENTTDSKAVVWSSSDSKVARVVNGTVTPVAAGKAVITAVSAVSGNMKAACQVTVTASGGQTTAVTGVQLDRKSVSLYPKKSVNLKATVLPANATNKAVSWTSSNPKAATVDKNGKVTGVKAGKAVITVTTADGNKKATCEVTIKQYVTKMSFKTPAYTVTKRGQKVKLKKHLTISPGNAADKSVTWKSSNRKIATVDKNGTVRFKAKKGKVTITATARDGSRKKAKITIIFGKKISEIKLNQTKLTLKKGKSKTIKAKITKPTKPAYKKLLWSSSNTKVATVSSKGKIKAVGKGRATITVLAGDGSGKKTKLKVTVK